MKIFDEKYFYKLSELLSKIEANRMWNTYGSELISGAVTWILANSFCRASILIIWKGTCNLHLTSSEVFLWAFCLNLLGNNSLVTSIQWWDERRLNLVVPSRITVKWLTFVKKWLNVHKDNSQIYFGNNSVFLKCRWTMVPLIAKKGTIFGAFLNTRACQKFMDVPLCTRATCQIISVVPQGSSTMIW